MKNKTNMGRLLLHRMRWFDRALLAVLNNRMGTNITSAQSLLFADLPRQGARQTVLAKTLGVSRQAVNELVRGLERQGLVEVVPDPASGRSKLVVPTDRGLASIDLAIETFAVLEVELQKRIGRQAVGQMRAALEAEWGESPQMT